MKKLIKTFLFLSLFFPLISFADYIQCYSSKELIYSHQVKKVAYTGDMFVFTETPSKKVYFFSGDCLVLVK